MFLKIGVLKSFENFTGKYLYWSLFLINLMEFYLKKISTQVFFCEICDSFKNTFFYKTTPVAASEYTGRKRLK